MKTSSSLPAVSLAGSYMLNRALSNTDGLNTSLREYDATYADCQMSSISSQFRPITNGFR